jgi:hypothetical protein
MARLLVRVWSATRLSRRVPEPIRARAAGLPTTRAAGPVTMSTRPAMSSDSTTQDMPVPSGRLNETAIECAVAVPDAFAAADGEGDGEGDGDFDADADADAEGDGDGDFDAAGFFASPVWCSTS